MRLIHKGVVAFSLIFSSLIGCTGAPMETVSTFTPRRDEPLPISPTNSPTPKTTIPQSSLTPKLKDYEFPDSIDPAKRYLFYLHGKIIEDQGIPAISPDYGEYEYEAILEKLSGYGFVVISEQRSKNIDGVKYARKIAEQVTTLLKNGVPAEDITVVGASKGAGITIFVSHFLKNEDINYVIMGICHPDIVDDLKQDQVFLSGNILSIFDSVDEYAGSCQELFSLSDGKGIARYDEIILNIGTGHGILYEPLDDWVLPIVQWANNNTE